jgi:hypothetical protein
VPVAPAAVEVLTALVGVLPRWGPWYLFGAQAVKQLAFPAGDWYLVQAAASYPCATGCKVMTEAREALGARALRTPVRLYALASLSPRGDVEPYELPVDVLFGHAAMPSL